MKLRMIRLTPVFVIAAIYAALPACTELTNAIEVLQAATRPMLPQVAIVSPQTDSTENVGVMGEIEWADIAPENGTFVTVTAQRFNASDELQGNITLLTGRDAQADGDADILHLDTTNFTPGRYRFVVTLTAPSGRTASATTTAVVTLQ